MFPIQARGMTRVATGELVRCAAAREDRAWDFAAILDAVPAALFVAGPDRTIRLVNHALVRLTGWAPSDLVGRPVDQLVPAPSRCRRADGTTFEAEVARSPVLLTAAGVVVSTIRDETVRVRTEAELFHRATHDGLTGLANRSLFVDRLAHTLDRLARHDGQVAVLFVDLDRFKEVNDRHGHAAGDAVLRAVADALAEAVRPADTVARVGGDEFVVLCELVDDDVAAGELADRVRAAVREATARALGADAGDLHVTASVGIAMAVHPSSPARLLDAADRAMYEAKRAGGDRVAFATPT
jgi:diguanylate cyclase (GGDEF)-like protein